MIFIVLDWETKINLIFSLIFFFGMKAVRERKREKEKERATGQAQANCMCCWAAAAVEVALHAVRAHLSVPFDSVVDSPRKSFLLAHSLSTSLCLQQRKSLLQPRNVSPRRQRRCLLLEIRPSDGGRGEGGSPVPNGVGGGGVDPTLWSTHRFGWKTTSLCVPPTFDQLQGVNGTAV